MASRYSTNEVLQLVLEDPVDESESENDLDGYVSDDNLSVISQQHDYEDDRVYRRDANDSNNIDDDSEDEDADENDVQMSDEFLSLPEFSGLSSCSKVMSNKIPIDFFELLFTQDIGNNIVAQTNLYAILEKETTHYYRIYAVPECNDCNGYYQFPKNRRPLGNNMAIL